LVFIPLSNVNTTLTGEIRVRRYLVYVNLVSWLHHNLHLFMTCALSHDRPFFLQCCLNPIMSPVD